MPTHSMQQTYKLIQMNVWLWRLYWPMRRFLERERPDLICAQESIDADHYIVADHYTARGLVTEGLAVHYIQAPGIHFDHVRGIDRQMGVAVLGNTPLQMVACPVIPDPANTDKPGYFRLLHTTTVLDGQTINILSYHGRLVIDRSLPLEGRMGTPATERDFIAVAAYIEKLAGPVVLTGDFNLFASAPALQPLKDLGLVNLIEVNNITVARNENAWKVDEAVSHVFISPHIKVMDFHVAKDIVSDHQPLVLEFSLQP